MTTSSNPPFRALNGPGMKVKPNCPWEPRIFSPDLSDGVEATWPLQNPRYRKSDARHYMFRLGEAWAHRDGSAKTNVNHYLKTLPAGYGAFETDQLNGSQVFKRLFGHPSGKFYDSILKFEPHFFWLLDGKHGQCECINCGNKPKPKPKPAQRLNPVERVQRDPRSASHISTEDDRSSRSHSNPVTAVDRTRRGRHADSVQPVDEEGNEHIYRLALQKLYKSHDSKIETINDFFEKASIDWQSERELIQDYLTQIEAQHSFVPRRGELVLWYLDHPNGEYLYRDPQNGEYKFYNFPSKKFTSFPRWRAGVVTAVPSSAVKNSPIDFPDILDTPAKNTALNTSGFRVETLPDPNNDEDKSLSKQYKYVPLRNIRPLSQWQLLLRGVSQSERHRSIPYALTCMTSLSLVEKTRLVGHWDEGAYVNAKACYHGSELITIGDAVRLVPETSGSSCRDILVVETIRLNMTGFKTQHLEPDAQRLCSALQIRFTGSAYTLDVHRAYLNPYETQENALGSVQQPKPIAPEDIIRLFRPVGTAQYGNWYPMHNQFKRLEVSYEQVLGRLYESDAVRIWSGQHQQKVKNRKERAAMKADLDFDTASIIAGRKYASQADERIPELPSDDPDGIRWLLSDHRAQALAIATLNGLEVAAVHETRTPATLEAWRVHTLISQGEQPPSSFVTPRQRRPKYSNFFTDEDGVTWSQEGRLEGAEGRRRGRPPGTKVIDGKVVTVEQFNRLAARGAKSKKVSRMLDTGDIENDGDEFARHADGSQPAFRSSQMADAAMDETEGSDMEDDQEFQARLAAYGSPKDLDEMLDVDPADFQIPQDGGRGQKSTRRSEPMSKAQILESVEAGSDGALDAMDDYEGGEESDEDFDEEIDYSKWGLARGGTEETEGGDYMESQ